MNAKEFKNPGKEYRPSPFWSWNDDLNPAELRRQVRAARYSGNRRERVRLKNLHVVQSRGRLALNEFPQIRFQSCRRDRPH